MEEDEEVEGGQREKGEKDRRNENKMKNTYCYG